MPLVTIVIFTPLIFAGIIGIVYLIMRANGYTNDTWIFPIGFIASGMAFLFSLSLVFIHNPNINDVQFVETSQWIPALGATYSVGLDGLSLWFFILTAFLTPLGLLIALREITDHRATFVISFLALETALLGVFASQDLFLFYIFWEASLIPMIFIIYIWGGTDKGKAVWKFVLYTLVGSFFMLASILYIIIQLKPVDLRYATLQGSIPGSPALDITTKFLLFAGFSLAFLIKLPSVPFHTWLPSAHVEAPTPGSVMLAGILLKMGGYGLVRFSLGWFPEVAESLSPLMMTLGIAGILYAGFMAFAQVDMKKVIAYSSIGHLGLALAGIFALNKQALIGAVFLMVGHGLTSGGLFSLVGVVYQRTHQRLRSHFGGLFSITPWYGTVFLLITLGAIGLPLTTGFVGEFLTIWGLTKVSLVWGLLGAVGAVLSAVYMLALIRDVFHGELHLPENIHSLSDLVGSEKFVFIVYSSFIFLFGIFPGLLLHTLSTYVNGLFDMIQPFFHLL